MLPKISYKDIHARPHMICCQIKEYKGEITSEDHSFESKTSQ